MPRPRFSRRRFLWMGTTAAAGLAIGIGVGGPRLRNAVRERLPAPTLGAEGWIEVSKDGRVRLYCNATEMGQGAWSALAQVMAEEMDADFSRVVVEMAPVTRPYFGPMDYSTGGSSSVRLQFETMRRLGASARHVLVRAAAARWQVDFAECAVRDGVIEHPASGRRAGFGEVAEAASRLSPPGEVPLKPRSQWRLIGKPVKRADVPSKIDGSAIYGTDVRLPGLKYASILHCPVPGGRLVAVDESPARAVAGVERVIRLDDAVVVVASAAWPALRGLGRLEPAWDPGPNAKESSAAIRADLAEAAARAPLERAARSDAGMAEHDAALALLAGAKERIDATYAVPFVAHAQMEPTNATAWWRDGRLDIWAPVQKQGVLRREIAERFGIGPDRVAVHTPLVGGRFGRGLEIDYALEAARLARETGHPLQVLWSREEDFRGDRFRPAAAGRLQAVLGPDGRVAAMSFRSVIAADSPGTAGFLPLPYGIPVAVERKSLARGVRTGPWRAIDLSQNVFFRESFLDECAHRAGRDPLAFRLAHLPAGSRASRTLEAVAALSGWHDRPASNRRLGLAFNEAWGTCCAIVAEAALSGSRLRIVRFFVAVDCGTTVNPSCAAAQVEGGIVQALGATLREEARVEAGQVVNAAFSSYAILPFSGTPQIEVRFLESPESPPGGLGEVAVPPTAASVVNAIAAATGVRIRSLPVSSDPRIALAG